MVRKIFANYHCSLDLEKLPPWRVKARLAKHESMVPREMVWDLETSQNLKMNQDLERSP